MKPNKPIELNRINLRLPEHIQEFYKHQGEKYSVPYTNYITMLLTQIYEKEQEKNLVTEFSNTLKDLKQLSGDVTVQEMVNELSKMQEMIEKVKE